jgi:endo-1,4-beta-xylanase
MQVRGHTLVWHESLPAWLTKGAYTRDDAAGILHEHIDTVMKHFKGKLLLWDMVNESIAYSPPYGPQPSFWRDTIGPDYVDMAFRWAREADPDVKLFYNDTGGEGLGAKSDAVYNLVKGMLDRGVPLDGIGLQMHVSLTGAPSPASVSANLQRLALLGLEIHITEMDVRVPSPATAANLAEQAAIYQGLVSACLMNAKCQALLTWGVSDANSWIPGAYPGFGSALLFNEQFQPKPAYQAVSAALAQ